MFANAAAAPGGSSVRTGSKRTVLYAGVGPELVHYDVDVEGAALVRRGLVRLPASVQYAWPHVSNQCLYVGSSARSAAGNVHHVTAFRIDSTSGALRPHGEPIALRHRPNHMTTDIPSEHVLISYTEADDPSDLTVHKINRDETIGAEVKQPAALDLGIHAHQIRVAPSNKAAILVARGNNGARGRPEDPGALKVFNYKDGVLTNRASIAPGGGFGFGPRHLDFHPVQPWVFVSLERQNKLYVHKLEGDTLSAEPLFRKDTLAHPGDAGPGQRQMAGAIHVHPNGRFVYVANRAYGKGPEDGKRTYHYVGGENNIAVYAINQGTGEPTLVQNSDTRGFSARTFALDPGGRMLVAGNMIPIVVKDGATVNTVPASLSVFRIGDDGKLAYVRKYDIDVGNGSMYWMGLMNY